MRIVFPQLKQVSSAYKVFLAGFFSAILAFTNSPTLHAFDEIFYSGNNVLFYSESARACVGEDGGGAGGAGVPLPAAVPEPWRSLIDSTAGTYPTSDRRLVAATLWAENRGWPEYKTSGWGESEAAAKGPWQFIPSTWASMGTDGDGDGRKDEDNPKDSVHAAFKHQLGSTDLPILYQATNNAEVDYATKPFYRGSTKASLMYFMAKYNGSGAPDGVTLSNFPRGQNSDYVRMGYWLISSNFEKGWLPEADKFVDAKTTGTLFGSPGSGGGGGGGANSASNCEAAGFGKVNAEGFSFPLAGNRNDIDNGYPLPCSPKCHHDDTAAFDLAKKAKDDSTAGIPVYAIRNGKIALFDNQYASVAGCQAFELVADDGYQYWYGHVQKASVQNGTTVKAGQQIAEVGRRDCTGNGSYPHLHIDRGYPKGQPGGLLDSRDKDFIPIMNKLYEQLGGPVDSKPSGGGAL